LKAWKESLAIRYRAGRARSFKHLEAIGERHTSVAVLTGSLEDFFRHRMTLHAGNFAYSGFLAIFPLVFTILAIIGYIFRYNPAVMQSAIESIRKMLPDFGANTIINASDSVARLRNVVGVLGILGLLWSVSRISYAINTGFDAVWEAGKKSYWKKRAFAFGVLLLVGLVGLIGLAITFASSQLLQWIDKETGLALSAIVFVVGLVLSPAATFLILSTLYRVIPRQKPGMREVFWGALTSALLLDAFEYLLSFYFTTVSKQQALYGSLGVLLGIVIWLYLVGILIFFGAEIVHVLQVRRGLALEQPGTSGNTGTGTEKP